MFASENSIRRVLCCGPTLLLLLCAAHVDPPPAVSRVRHKAISIQLEPSITLTASQTHIAGDHPVFVSASWNNLPASMINAWVGLYLAGEDLTQVVPLKYNFCNRSRSLSAFNSSGSLFFRILNYRADVVFRLFHGWEAPVLIAESKRITIALLGHPTGVRLALTKSPGEVAITWTSTHAHAKGACVSYDIHDADGHLIKHDIAEARESVSYRRGELCGAPANSEGFRDPGVFYTSRIIDIKLGSIVKYRVGSELAWSQTFSFRAPPAPGTPVKIFAFGDLGEHPQDDSAQAQDVPWYSQQFAYGDPGVPNTTAAMLMDHREAPADLVLHNGDLSYAMGYSSMWEVFHDNIEPLSAEIPWMIAMGNHERDWPGTNSTTFGDTDSMGECGVPTMRRFAAQPFVSHLSPPNDQPWYSLSLGVVSFLVISTEHDIAPGSKQYSWIVENLARVDRVLTPWLVLVGHRPYVVDSSWSGDEDFSRYFQGAIGNLLEKHQVDLVLGGHHHSYQRSCSLSRGKCSAEGVVILNVGMAGAGLNRVNKTLPSTFLYANDKDFGYCRIHADKDYLKAEYVLSATQQVEDSILLRKNSQAALYN